MAKYLVTYDLVGTAETSQDYARLIEAIQSYPNWGRVQKSVWLINSSKEIEQIYNHLARHMDANDRLLIVEVQRNSIWHNETCERSWLMNFFNS